MKRPRPCAFIRRLGPLVLTLTAAFFAPRPAEAAAERPNILFILSDDHAAHALSCYGSKINETPNLDRIAAAGMRFANCFVVNSICTPSRAAILTGKYSHKNGVTVFNRFDGSQPHVAKLLQAAGYQTALVGKWHLFSDPNHSRGASRTIPSGSCSPVTAAVAASLLGTSMDLKEFRETKVRALNT
jgi:arylsulfatase A-like enzyme